MLDSKGSRFMKYWSSTDITYVEYLLKLKLQLLMSKTQQGTASICLRKVGLPGWQDGELEAYVCLILVHHTPQG